ncbi:MAG: NAD-dependent deacylase [Geminicoccaceae bacterium]
MMITGSMFDPSKSILILTGAGISAESGLATFRDAGGLWEGHRPEDVATPEAFARDPPMVHRFYNARRRQLHDPTIEPNAAHKALVALEKAWPAGIVLVTQNVDNLHKRAGSQSLLPMHGELDRVVCTACGQERQWLDDLWTDTVCPNCQAVGRLRPSIVWFGEIPRYLDEIEAAIERCGLFMAIGTSGLVYPAAGFVQGVRASGDAHTVEINLERSAVASAFAEHILGPAAIETPKFVDRILAAL